MKTEISGQNFRIHKRRNHLDAEKIIKDSSCAEEIKHLLNTYGLNSWAISAHLEGQCVGDAKIWAYDPRLDHFAPENLPESQRKFRSGLPNR